MAMRADGVARAGLARIVQELRVARLTRSDLPQQVLAARLEVVPGSVIDWEAGRDDPTMHHLIRWVQALDLSLAIYDSSGLRRDDIVDAMDGESRVSGEIRRLASALRAVRMEDGVSQSEIADKLGVHRWSISRWECAQGHPRPVGLLTWAHTLTCEVKLRAACAGHA